MKGGAFFQRGDESSSRDGEGVVEELFSLVTDPESP